MDVKLTDLSALVLDATEDTITVSYLISVSGTDVPATYAETIVMGRKAPEYLRKAATEFTEAVTRAVRERYIESGVVPCTTCTGACCRTWDIRLTLEDIERMKQNPEFDETDVTLYADKSFGGFDAIWKLVPWVNPSNGETEMACPFLGDDGRCTTYETRPSVCRDYSAFTCGDKYEKHEKRRLPVVG